MTHPRRGLQALGKRTTLKQRERTIDPINARDKFQNDNSRTRTEGRDDMTDLSTSAIVILACRVVSLVVVGAEIHPYEYSYATNLKEYTRMIHLKQGDLRGIVVSPRENRQLPDVEQYLGIPYAAAPVGKLRFMPPGSAPRWKGTKTADSFGPVCPQRFPGKKGMPHERQDHFRRIEEYLQNQSEDCLYLNIYSPVQDVENPMIFPVMVFIHGGGFEWGAGSLYDGSILAGYGHVIVVTINFRLGILGFLKPGLEGEARSNFGLIDQIAALLWVQDNIVEFGGNPNTVTLFGQETGAVCANFLMMSPMIIKEGNKLLFHRAILMSGTALSDWALVKNPALTTLQVANSLNCPSNGRELEECLRKKRLKDLLEITVLAPEYQMQFGPTVDQTVIPTSPERTMSSFNDIFRRFELMYGVAEVESAHLLNAVAMAAGMLQEERDNELRQYFEVKFESNVDFILAHTVSEYAGNTENEMISFNGQSPDSGSIARDTLLDILSDVRTVAPMMKMAKLHSALNQNSYFYVFGHKTLSNKFYRTKSITGDELPYVFGIPLDGPRGYFQDVYTKEEKLFSEVIMTFYTNFAYQGDPNVPKRHNVHMFSPSEWKSNNWIEFDSNGESYMYLDIIPESRFHYRERQMAFWNELLPKLMDKQREVLTHRGKFPENKRVLATNILTDIFARPVNISPIFRHSYPKGKPTPSIGIVKTVGTERADPRESMEQFGTVITVEPGSSITSTVKIVIAVGTLFLLVNVTALFVLYYKCIRLRKRIRQRGDLARARSDDLIEREPDVAQPSTKRSFGCSLMKMITKSSKSEEAYEAVKMGEGDSSGKMKLIRQMSSSTVDAHSKVRDWITQEIVHKCSPRFLRKSKHSEHSKDKDKRDKEEPSSLPGVLNSADSTSTINRSPTRPVSPIERQPEVRKAEHFKTCAIPVHKPPPNKSMSKTHPKVSHKRAEKVSVAIDATPSGRGSSVLRQQPIELMKSFEFTKSFDGSSNESDRNLRRSATLDDVNSFPKGTDSLRRSSTSINLKLPEAGWTSSQPTIVKIEHHHSKSDPVQGLASCIPRSGTPLKRLRSFEPEQDVNVTSRDDLNEPLEPLSPEQQLMTIKRRNFPKVLPDYPGRRLSMPTSNQLFHTIPEKGMTSSLSQPTYPNRTNGRVPPAPPPRTTSSLGRVRPPLTHSQAVLAEEPPEEAEPEIACNNLFVGPILPVRGIKKPQLSSSESYKLTSQPIYDNLNPRRRTPETASEKREPKTIITADPENPVKRMEPKVIIKPTTSRKPKEVQRSKVPRVQANPEYSLSSNITRQNGSSELIAEGRSNFKNEGSIIDLNRGKVSMIPVLGKSKRDTDNSSTGSSEASDTGTVVKRV